MMLGITCYLHYSQLILCALSIYYYVFPSLAHGSTDKNAYLSYSLPRYTVFILIVFKNTLKRVASMKTRSQMMLLAGGILSIILLHVFYNVDGSEPVVRIRNIDNIAPLQKEVHKRLEKDSEADPSLDVILESNCQIRHALYPDENLKSDRVIEQLAFKPCQNASKPKKILIWSGVDNWGGIHPKQGNEVFQREACPVSNCVLTSDHQELTADLIIFKDGSSRPKLEKPTGQLWMIYLLESPFHVSSRLNGYDWTATYRRDSTIVAPYAKWAYFDNSVTATSQTINYAGNKTKQVAWFVSNCNAKNARMEYAKELAKHIEVDIYGSCGDKKCPKSSGDCKSMLSQDYKFYLSFENSNCKDYITEKFFTNALQSNIIPIVMGASVEDYEAVAPHGSFIHVDQFDSPKELAAYLHELSVNDAMYNQYFSWKGTGTFIPTKFFCRVCAMLHYHHEHLPDQHKPNLDWDTWWKGPDICQTSSGKDLYN